MQATSVLREQLKMAQNILEQAMDGLPFEHLHRTFDGATIQSIATIYTHTVTGEDFLIHTIAKQEPMLYEREGWRDAWAKAGIVIVSDNPPGTHEEIASAVQGKEMDAVREYAQAVYASTDEYLSTLSEDDLNRTITFGQMGDMPLGKYLGSLVIWDIVQHGGEICALKGIQGGQGLPF